MRRRTHLLPLVGLALLVCIPSISAQSDTVSLQWKLTPGEALFFSTGANLQITLSTSAGVRETAEGRFEAREVIRALDVAALGAIWIEATVEDYRLTERGGQPQEQLQPAVSFRVDPDGKVVERFSDPAERPDFPFPLPGRPVRVGESWTRSATSTTAELVVKGNGTYTLAGFSSGPEGRRARVTFTNEGTASETGTILRVIQMATRTSSKVTGEFEWLLDRGRLGRYSQEFTLISDTQVTLPGVSSGLARRTAKATVRSDPLPPQTLAAPDPNLTVLPGQGIGPLTLSMTMEELNSRNGASELREFDLGYLSHSFRWHTGLVAYVSVEANNKIVGLETNDRRYRSAKGAGVAMSEGAVRLAHGLAPVRLEMSLPGLGHYRVLVYDSEGVAFAVVSEENLRARHPLTRMPVGLVAWLTVFPPGEGGKIYPLGAR